MSVIEGGLLVSYKRLFQSTMQLFDIGERYAIGNSGFVLMLTALFPGVDEVACKHSS